MPDVIDSYSESNQDSVGTVGDDVIDSPGSCAGGLGQCFTGNGEKITDTRFYLRRHNSPTGNLVSKIYSLTGSFGTTGNCNTLLATSDNVNVSTLGTSFALVTFTYTGGQQYTTTNGTKYVAVVEYPPTGGTNVTNYIELGYDGSSGTHPGNFVFHNHSTGSAWTAADGSIDICFYVDGVSIDVTVNLTGVAASPAIGTGAIDCDFSLSGVSCLPAIGTGTVDIEGEIVPPISHATGPMAVRRPRKVKPTVLVDVEFGIRQGVAADVITGAGRFDAATPVPPLPYEMTVFDPLALIDVTCPFGAGPMSVVLLGKGTVTITSELYEDEIAALLDSI